jgi:Ricin-type beta-trefoil lectin domain/IPT/TIG domain
LSPTKGITASATLAALVLGPVLFIGGPTVLVGAQSMAGAARHPATAVPRTTLLRAAVPRTTVPETTVPPAIGNVRHLARAVTGRPVGLALARGARGAIARDPAARASVPDPGRVTYNGGPVQQHPVVYLVFWGPWWYSSTNPSGGGAALENELSQLFDGGIGEVGDAWSVTLAQYKDSSGLGPQLGAGVWGGSAVDSGSTPPPVATNAQIAAEAAAWADHWKVAGDVNAQIIVVSPHLDDPGGGFPANYCAWHDQTSDAQGKFVAYTNLPYLPDAGAACGGADAADASIVAGHEFAETVTDPGAEATSGVRGAWYDGPGSANPDGDEIADKCQWFELGNVTMPDGTFLMQRLWSNGGSYCALAHRPTVTGLTMSGGPAAGGTAVTVDGTQLLGGSVTFGTVPATGSCTPTSCTVQSPPGELGVVDVRVSTSGGQSTILPADRFSYNVGPGQVAAANRHCLNDAHSSTSIGNKIDVWTCANGRLGQIWLYTGYHSLRVVGKCLSVAGLYREAKAVLAGCAGRPSEHWLAEPASAGLVEYRNPASGLCLTDPGNSTTNGTAVVIMACANLASQHWSTP